MSASAQGPAGPTLLAFRMWPRNRQDFFATLLCYGAVMAATAGLLAIVVVALYPLIVIAVRYDALRTPADAWLLFFSDALFSLPYLIGFALCVGIAASFVHRLTEEDGRLAWRRALGTKSAPIDWRSVRISRIEGLGAKLLAYLQSGFDRGVHRVGWSSDPLYRVGHPYGLTLISPADPAVFEQEAARRGAVLSPGRNAPPTGKDIAAALTPLVTWPVAILLALLVLLLPAAMIKLLADRPDARDWRDYPAAVNVVMSPALLRVYLAFGWNAGDRDSDGNPLLVTAALYQAPQATLGLLVAKGADINAAGRSYTPLEAAAYPYANRNRAKRYREDIQFLIASGADPRKWINVPPIVHVASSLDIALVDYLLGKGADINTLGKRGDSALSAVLARYVSKPEDESRRRAMVDHLIARGARAIGVSSQQPLLYLAALRGYADIVDRARNQGATLDAAFEIGRRPGRAYRTYALNLAAERQSMPAVTGLLRVATPADVNRVDELGLTPLMRALSPRDLNAKVAGAIASSLVAGGAELGGRSPLHPEYSDRDANGNTVLHLAARAGLRDIVTWALGKGADIHAVNKMGKTPLDLAAASKRTGAGEVVAYLKARGGREGSPTRSKR